MSPTKIEKPLDVYVRVSRVGGRDGESFISPQVQETRCRAMATAKGYDIGKVYNELDRSGGSMEKREALDEALQRVYSGESGGIIVATLDRFARNVVDLLTTVEKVEAAGGAVVIIEPAIDTADEAFGKFLLTLFGGLAELELGRIRATWAKTHTNMIARGVHSGSAPAGYTKGEGKRLVPNGNADDIREAFRMRARATPANFGDVARFLTERDVPTAREKALARREGREPHGSHWNITSARKLIANRAYLGEARSGDKVKVDAHPALVDTETFLLANRTFSVSQFRGRERSDGPLLGGGLCRCGACGGGMVRGTARHGEKTYAFIRCQSTGCGTSIQEHKLSPFVVEEAFARLATMTKLPKTVNAKKTAVEIARIVREMDATDEAEAAGELSALEAGKVRTALAAQRVEAEAAFATDMGGRQAYLRDHPTRVRERLFPDGTPADVKEARMFLKDMLGSVAVFPGVKGRTQRVEERVRFEGPCPACGIITAATDYACKSCGETLRAA